MSGLLPVRAISDIKLGETRWHAQVIVLDKSVVRTGKGGAGRRQKSLLQDAQGNTIELMLWEDDIDKFADTLEPFKSYSVQGARVKKIKEQYQRWSPKNTLEWSIAPGTTIEPIADPNKLLPYPAFDATDLSVVQRFNSDSDPFDVIAAVVDIQEPREVPTSDGLTMLQDAVLVDQSLSLTPFTLWGEFLPNHGTDLLEMKHTMPIIICRNLTISKYTGFPSTNLSTYITIEPDIPEAVTLRTWVRENVNTIRNLETRMKTQDQSIINTTNITLPTQEGSSSSANAQRFSVTGKLHIPDVYQPIAYCICEKCTKLLCAEMKKEVRCRNCNAIRKAIPSYKLAVHIQTTDENKEATMFDKATEKLLQRSPEQIHIMPAQQVKNLLETINKEFETKTIDAVLKPSPKKYASQKELYSVQQWEVSGDPFVSESESEATQDSLTPPKTISIATQENLSPVAPLKAPPATTAATTTPEKQEKKRNKPDEKLTPTIPTTKSEQQEKAKVDAVTLKKVKIEHAEK